MRALERIQPLDLAVQTVRDDERCQLGNLDREARLLGLFIRHAEQHQGCAALRLPGGLDGSDLGRLVLARIDAVQVTHGDLQRDQQRGHRDRTAQGQKNFRTAVVA